MLNTIWTLVTGRCLPRARRWLPLLALACWGALASSALAAPAVLRVLAWPGYADPDLVAVFEKRHGVRVEITTVGSDDTLRAKFADTKAPAYDVVAANTVEIARFVELQQEIKEMRQDIKDLTSAWQQAKGVVSFMKWVAGIGGSVGAWFLFFKDHWK